MNWACSGMLDAGESVSRNRKTGEERGFHFNRNLFLFPIPSTYAHLLLRWWHSRNWEFHVFVVVGMRNWQTGSQHPETPFLRHFLTESRRTGTHSPERFVVPKGSHIDWRCFWKLYILVCQQCGSFPSNRPRCTGEEWEFLLQQLPALLHGHSRQEAESRKVIKCQQAEEYLQFKCLSVWESKVKLLNMWESNFGSIIQTILDNWRLGIFFKRTNQAYLL